MTDNLIGYSRAGMELFDATRPFAEESRLRSWWCVGSTLTALMTVLGIAAFSPWWPVRLSASLLGGLLLVRVFILFHDFQHGSLLRGSRLAAALFYTYGLVALTPPRHWRQSHNFHHANVGKPVSSDKADISLVTSDIGSFSLMSTEVWRNATTWQRLRYRISRHPLTILFAYLAVFLGSPCMIPFVQDPRKNWGSVVSLITHLVLIGILWTFEGLSLLFFVWLFPFTIAAALGAYLFFAQQNFKGMRVVPIEQWTHYRGALESSSYLKLGPIMRWFTGNIGYHHVHHLNSLIPFYRLPEAMSAVPELQRPIVTSLHPSDIVACLRLNLWDWQKQKPVRYKDAILTPRQSQSACLQAVRPAPRQHYIK